MSFEGLRTTSVAHPPQHPQNAFFGRFGYYCRIL
jgi:hypothetical protein